MEDAILEDDGLAGAFGVALLTGERVEQVSGQVSLFGQGQFVFCLAH